MGSFVCESDLSLSLGSATKLSGNQSSNPEQGFRSKNHVFLDLNQTPDQSVLEESFKGNLNQELKQKKILEPEVNVTADDEVEVLFESRRARSKQWKKSKKEMAEEIERLKQELEMANFQASKRARLDGAFSQLPVPRDANGDCFCPNCHHILKPTPKYGGIPKVPRS